MKAFFIVLGVLIVLSAAGLVLALLAQLFVSHPLLPPVVKVLSAVLFLTGLVYSVTLFTIPHGRIK